MSIVKAAAVQRAIGSSDPMEFVRFDTGGTQAMKTHGDRLRSRMGATTSTAALSKGEKACSSQHHTIAVDSLGWPLFPWRPPGLAPESL